MMCYFERRKERLPFRLVSLFVCLTFIVSLITPPVTLAQTPVAPLNLPPPGTMVSPSPIFAPPLLKGIKIYPENALQFDFLIDSGETGLKGESLRSEAERAIKYFLAALTIAEDDLWVNLSPYEQNKIVPEKLGQTNLGRDLLAQDYLLKQLTASLVFPEGDLGKTFWNKVYAKAQELFGTTEIPINTFNKVWIIPDRAVVYEKDGTAMTVDSHLKVMLEEDYLALANNLGKKDIATSTLDTDKVKAISKVSSPVVREVILPAIEKEVNEGKNFTELRQIYNAIILATWFKKTLHESLLGQVFVDKGKILGVETDDRSAKDQIYQQYLQAFKKGVYNYIKEDIDQNTNKPIPRKYFSGGFTTKDATGALLQERMKIVTEAAQLPAAAQVNLTHLGDVAKASGITSVTVRLTEPDEKQFPDSALLVQASSGDVTAFQNAVERVSKNLSPDRLKEVGVLETQWAADGIARKYPAKAVVAMRPHENITPDYSVAKSQAKMFTDGTNQAPIVSLGALSAAQAIEYVKSGARAIYVSGWQIAGKQMYPDISSHSEDEVVGLAGDIIEGMRKASTYESRLGRSFTPVPVIVDIDAGFGGPAKVFNLVSRLLKAGVGVIHIENQDPCEKECGHLGNKIENTSDMYLNNVAAARLAADIAGVPLVIIGRTDSEAATSIRGEADNDPVNRDWLIGTTGDGRQLTLNEAKLEGLTPIWDADQAERDHKIQTFGSDKVWVADRQVEGYYTLMKKGQATNIDYAIATALAFSPYVNFAWMESKTPDLNEAMHFAEAIHEKFPGKPLAYNLSPSFNWLKYFESDAGKTNFIQAIKRLDIKPTASFDWDKDYTPQEAMRTFTYAIGQLGYKFSFVTLAGFHTERLGAHDLAKEFFGGDYMKAYSAFQQREFTAQTTEGFTAVKHQEEVGSEFYEALDILVKGGETSRALLKASTEAAQFVTQVVPEMGRKITRYETTLGKITDVTNAEALIFELHIDTVATRTRLSEYENLMATTDPASEQYQTLLKDRSTTVQHETRLQGLLDQAIDKARTIDGADKMAFNLNDESLKRIEFRLINVIDQLNNPSARQEVERDLFILQGGQRSVERQLAKFDAQTPTSLNERQTKITQLLSYGQELLGSSDQYIKNNAVAHRLADAIIAKVKGGATLDIPLLGHTASEQGVILYHPSIEVGYLVPREIGNVEQQQINISSPRLEYTAKSGKVYPVVSWNQLDNLVQRKKDGTDFFTSLQKPDPALFAPAQLTFRQDAKLGNLKNAYPDVYTPKAISVLEKVAPLTERIHMLNEKEAIADLERAKKGQDITFLPTTNPDGTDYVVSGMKVSVNQARAGDFEGAPVPKIFLKPGATITGPTNRDGQPLEKSQRSIAYQWLSGAEYVLEDGEDSLGQSHNMSIDGIRNLNLAIKKDPAFMKVVESVAQEMISKGKRPADWNWRKLINENYTVPIYRVRGFHLDDRHLQYKNNDGIDVPMAATLTDATLYLANNYETLLDNNLPLAIYFPKIDSAEKAALLAEYLDQMEANLEYKGKKLNEIPLEDGKTGGIIKVALLIENVKAATQLMEIRAALGRHLVLINTARWDYLATVIKAKDHDNNWVPEDFSQIGMTYPFMQTFEDRVWRAANTPDKNNNTILWEGGMEVQIPTIPDPIPQAEKDKYVTAFMDKARANKTREAQAGAPRAWVAHPDMVEIVATPFKERYGEGKAQIISQKANLDGVQWTPLAYTPDDARAFFALRPSEQQKITLQGFDEDISVYLQYKLNVLTGNGAAAIKPANFFADPSVPFLMEDRATDEGRGSGTRKKVKVEARFTHDDPGGVVKAGDPITKELFLSRVKVQFEKLLAAPDRLVNDYAKPTILPITRLALEKFVLAAVEKDLWLPWSVDLETSVLDVSDPKIAETLMDRAINSFAESGGIRRMTGNPGFVAAPLDSALFVSLPSPEIVKAEAAARLFPTTVVTRAAAELSALGLRGASQRVSDILGRTDLSNEAKLRDVNLIFTDLYQRTGKAEIESIVALLSTKQPDATLSSDDLKKMTTAVKDTSDALAKRIFEKTAQDEGIIMMVRVSEGFGRDQVAESLKANEVIVPEALKSEINRIYTATTTGEKFYTATSGKVYPIVNSIVDVIEGTNMFVTNSNAKQLGAIEDFESGSTSVIVTGQGVGDLGNAPDGYVGQFFTNLGKDAETFKQMAVSVGGQSYRLYDPELYAAHPEKILDYLNFLAQSRGQSLSGLNEEVVVMSRDRETKFLDALKEIKTTHNIQGLKVTTIADGTVAHGLKAVMTPATYNSVFGREYGSHKTVITVGGSAEGFMNLSIAGALKSQGAIAGMRVYSAGMNKDTSGQTAKDQSARYNFSADERSDIQELRGQYNDAGSILSGQKLFTSDDVKGDVSGAFSFISTNGVFAQNGVVTDNNASRVRMLKIESVSGMPKVALFDNQVALGETTVKTSPADLRNQLRDIAAKMVPYNGGILAADESTSTAGQRLTSVGLENTPENRQRMRQMMLTAPGQELAGVNAVILFDETFDNVDNSGNNIVRHHLLGRGILPGIKTDRGLIDDPASPGEKIPDPKGLAMLPGLLKTYGDKGAVFTKWRTTETIDPVRGLPTDGNILRNAEVQAQQARMAQEAGLVPMVEPEVLLDGTHDINASYNATTRTLDITFNELQKQGVFLDGMILKTSMILSGNKAENRANSEAVGYQTFKGLLKTVPEEVPAIVFLSGGQGDEEANVNLNAVIRASRDKFTTIRNEVVSELRAEGKNAQADKVAGFTQAPWEISYSFGRGLQRPALKAWAGNDANFAAGQAAQVESAQMSQAARLGKLQELKQPKDSALLVESADQFINTTENPYWTNMKQRVGDLRDYVSNPQIVEQLQTPYRVFDSKGEWATEKNFMDIDGNVYSPEIYMVRVVNNNARGPGKGGIRWVTGSDLTENPNFAGAFSELQKLNPTGQQVRNFVAKWISEEAKALSLGMTLKNSGNGLALGGGKGTVFFGNITQENGQWKIKDYEAWSTMSDSNKAKIARRHSLDLAEAGLVGPEIDIPAPDVRTTPQILSWYQDEYLKYLVQKTDIIQSADAELHSRLAGVLSSRYDVTSTPLLEAATKYSRETGKSVPWLGVYTGKPVDLGGSLGRTEATGEGLVDVMLGVFDNNLKGKTVAIHGFGNVAQYAALRAVDLGAKITHISDSEGVYIKNDGWSKTELKAIVDSGKRVSDLWKQGLISKGGVEAVTGSRSSPEDQERLQEAVLWAPVDVLIPAALENDITSQNQAGIQAKWIFEGANGPVTPQAEQALFQRGIKVVPDTLANAGGVTVSSFETEQAVRGEWLSKDQIAQRRASVLDTSLKSTLGMMKKYPDITVRTAFDLVAAEGILASQRPQRPRIVDSAIFASELPGADDVGGINLNPSLMNLQIKRDGNGIPLPVMMQPLNTINIQGFTPVIINIAPAVNIPLLLGVTDKDTLTQPNSPSAFLKPEHNSEELLVAVK